MGKLPGNSQIWALLVIAAAVAVLTLPFINQPFNQDDRDFVEFARASANDITRLSIENYTYEGKYFKNYRDPHGPLLTTYLGVPLRMGAAESEALFHGLYLIFPLIGAFSMYYLARRFTRHALFAALLLLFTPGFLVLSHTLMDNHFGPPSILGTIAPIARSPVPFYPASQAITYKGISVPRWKKM
ncbi:MAG: hypothetical protein ACYCW5_04945 [Thermoleophilia bacterium]